MEICNNCDVTVNDGLEFDFSCLKGETGKNYYIVTYYKTFLTWKVTKGPKELIEPHLNADPFELQKGDGPLDESGAYRTYVLADNPGDALNIGQNKIERFLSVKKNQKWAILGLSYKALTDESNGKFKFEMSIEIMKIFDDYDEAFKMLFDNSNPSIFYQLVKLPS